jgi:hypothetical protein
MKRKSFKYIFAVVVIIVACLALMDAVGLFNPKPYRTVTVGATVHYVPKNRDPKVNIEKFPTVKPLPSEVITPTGQLISKDSLKAKKE